MADAQALTPAITLLLVGILAMTVARRLGLSAIVGYLTAGVLIGPYALGLIHESKTTHLLAELGVVFLLFDIGLHFTLSSLWEARRDILGLGPLQILLCGIAFGGVAIVMGLGPRYAILVGGALALSSTAVVVHTLAERVQQNCPVGLTGTAVLILQDICAIFLLIFAASLANGGTASPAAGLLAAVSVALLKAIVAFVAAVFLGRYAIKPLFRFVSKTRNEEVFTAIALLVVLATAAGTGHSGLPLTLGAFLGGMIISETPYRHLIRTEAKPFRNLLLGFFFITVGMSLDWHMLLAHWAAILAFVVVLMAVKAVLVGIAARVFGWSVPGAVQLGFLLAQGSEFVFVIVAMPAVRETLGEGMVGTVFTGVAASLVLTPAMAALGNHIARRLKERATMSMPVGEATPGTTLAPVLIIGLDEVGRTVADALEAHGLEYDAIDSDHERLLAAGADGYPVAFGDAADARLMETLRYSEREALVLAGDGSSLAEELEPIMQARYPRLTRFVGVDAESDKLRIESAPLHPVVDRSFPRGLDLAGAVLRFQHIDEAKVQAWMHRQQERALQVGSGREALSLE